MELNNKEKKIKQVLTEINYDIDTDFLWKDVSKELDKKKRRRYLWFIPLFLLVGFAMTYLFLNYEINPANSISATNQDEAKEAVSAIQKEATTEKEVADIESTQSSNRLSSEALIDAKQNIINHSTKIQNRLAAEKVQLNLISNSPSSNTLIKEVVSVNNNNFTPSTSKINIVKEEITELVKETIFPETKISSIPSLLEIGKMPLSSFIANRDQETIEDDQLESIQVKNHSTIRFFVTLGAGAIRNINTTNTIEGEFSNEYFDRQLELPGINASLLFGLQTKNNWRFFGGIDYAQLVTRYTNNSQEIIDGTIPIDNQQIIDANNSYQTTEGALTTVSEIDNDISWHQYHNLYNLQVGLSKNLLIDSRFSVSPEFSLIQNISSTHSGYYFSEQYPHLTKFNAVDENPYRKNTGISSQLALSLGYQLRRFEISVNTAWRNPFNTITKETNFYQTKNSQLSIQARVNYLLNWENK